ncbi:MAG: fibrobacter succinogenes major paralogous domain-containing protein [Prevotellaceae bacterium]|nr:fibrobacter succinogenes major paralogous domain-containing protein [Prevotellaceae bacterium]
MMKKIFNLLTVLSFTIAAFAQEATTSVKTDTAKAQPEVVNVQPVAVSVQLETVIADTAKADTSKNGVIINGVIWAKSNVDEPGKFAINPEDQGMFYQWNRYVGWCGVDPLINSNDDDRWDSIIPIGFNWEKDNDPSPKGWRIPTFDEIDKLLDTDIVDRIWITENGVSGTRFTDKTTNNSIFLPAAGYRNVNDGSLNDVGIGGNYWSSTQNDSSTAYSLFIYTLSAGRFASGSGYGFSIRCVSEEGLEIPEEEIPMVD